MKKLILSFLVLVTIALSGCVVVPDRAYRSKTTVIVAEPVPVFWGWGYRGHGHRHHRHR